ncbi:MAG: TRAP transporter small permease subunit [bacterium]|nr:TRAP transporter small permease subunit [bacterium]
MSRNIVDAISNSKIYDWLVKIQKYIMLATTIIMLLVLSCVVVMRYVFHKDFFGYDEIVLISSFWMYFIGASYAMYEGTHVKADIFMKMFSDKTQSIIKVFAGTVQTALSMYVTFLAYQLIIRSLVTKGITTSYNIPFIVPQMSIFVGFALATFYLTLYTLKDLSVCINKFKIKG